METYQSKFDKAAKFKAACDTSNIQNSLINSVADEICKDRAALAMKAMSKIKSLVGQFYKDSKPDVPGTYTDDAEGKEIQLPGTWSSKEAKAKAGKLKENLDKLNLALTACLTSEFVLGPTVDVEATAEGGRAIRGISEEKQREKFTEDVEARWKTLAKYTNKEEKDNYIQW